MSDMANENQKYLEGMRSEIGQIDEEEESKEEDEANKNKDFDDRPFKVVPNYVTNRFDWIEEPHERRIRTPIN